VLDHLIVDGYNILYAWAAGRGRGRGAAPDAIALARQTLLRDLETAAAARDIHCTIVFDGAPIEDLLHASSSLITVLFAGPRDTADTVIERLVCQRAERCGVVVVTDDRMEGNLITGWGAHCWSSTMLARWLHDASSG